MRALAILVVALCLLPLAPGVASTSPAWGPAGTATIRPGSLFQGICTMNFLYTDAAGAAYVGTAAHCTDAIGQRVSVDGDGPDFGTVVFDSDVSPGARAFVDFALVRIDADKVHLANPLMRGHDGPKGAVTREELAAGDLLSLHGHGQAMGLLAATRTRPGVLVEVTARGEYRADMASDFGDSGGPILHVETGKALGIISRWGINARPSTDIGPTMGLIFEELGRAGIQVELATAP